MTHETEEERAKKRGHRWIGFLFWVGMLALLDAAPSKAGFLHRVESWAELVPMVIGAIVGFQLAEWAGWSGKITRLIFAIAIAVICNKLYTYGNCALLPSVSPRTRVTVMTSIAKKQVYRIRWYYNWLDGLSLSLLGWRSNYFLTVPLPPWTPGAEAVLVSRYEFRHPRWQRAFQELQQGDRVRVTLVRGAFRCPCVQDIEKIAGKS